MFSSSPSPFLQAIHSSSTPGAFGTPRPSNLFGSQAPSPQSNQTITRASSLFGSSPSPQPNPGIFGASSLFVSSATPQTSSPLGDFGEAKPKPNYEKPYTFESKFRNTITSGNLEGLNAQGLITNAEVYILAEKYDIKPLKYRAKAMYEEIIPGTWNTPSFVESLELIYEGTPDSPKIDMLRGLALCTAAKHAKELMDRGEFVTLCKKNGELSTDILKTSLGLLGVSK